MIYKLYVRKRDLTSRGLLNQLNNVRLYNDKQNNFSLTGGLNLLEAKRYG